MRLIKIGYLNFRNLKSDKISILLYLKHFIFLYFIFVSNFPFNFKCYHHFEQIFQDLVFKAISNDFMFNSYLNIDKVSKLLINLNKHE